MYLPKTFNIYRLTEFGNSNIIIQKVYLHKKKQTYVVKPQMHANRQRIIPRVDIVERGDVMQHKNSMLCFVTSPGPLS